MAEARQRAGRANRRSTQNRPGGGPAAGQPAAGLPSAGQPAAGATSTVRVPASGSRNRRSASPSGSSPPAARLVSLVNGVSVSVALSRLAVTVQVPAATPSSRNVALTRRFLVTTRPLASAGSTRLRSSWASTRLSNSGRNRGGAGGSRPGRGGAGGGDKGR